MKNLNTRYDSTDDYEIREYSSYLVAETRVSGDFDRTGNATFQRSAGYIFGDNRRVDQNDPDDTECMSMKITIPVTGNESRTKKVDPPPIVS